MKKRLSNERGAVALTVALLLLPLVGVLALTVDLGSRVAARRAAVNAADAAALAVAQDCTTIGSGSSQATAERLAVENVDSFPGAGVPVVTVTGSGCDPLAHSDGNVRVDVQFTVPAYFSGILGSNGGTISSTATAAWEWTSETPSTPGDPVVGNGSQNGPGGGHTKGDPHPAPGADCDHHAAGGPTPGANVDHCPVPVWSSDFSLVG